MIAPSIWIDPKNGNDYFLTVQYPEPDIHSVDTLLNIPYAAPATMVMRTPSCCATLPASTVRPTRRRPITITSNASSSTGGAAR